MLGKLIKYEFKYLFKSYTPIYIAAFFFVLLSFYTINVGEQAFNNTGLMIVIAIFATLLFSATAYLSLHIQYKRYYDGVYGSEGYLLNTLPINSHQIILSKTISFYLINLVTFILAFISFIVLATTAALKYMDITHLLNDLTTFITTIIDSGYLLNISGILINTQLAVVLWVLFAQLIINLANNKLFVKNKLLYGMIFFLVFGIIILKLQIDIANYFYSNNIGYEVDKFYYTLHPLSDIIRNSAVWQIMAFDILVILLLYFINNYLIKNHLNLE